MEHRYHIPHLPLPFDIETKAVMKQLISANRKLAELRGVAQTIPNLMNQYKSPLYKD